MFFFCCEEEKNSVVIEGIAFFLKYLAKHWGARTSERLLPSNVSWITYGCCHGIKLSQRSPLL